MRPLAILPAICCVAALILAFLCLFAGHQRDFMEDYHLLTLNTSRLGYNLLNGSLGADNPITNLFSEFTNDFTDEINEAVGDLAEQLGVDDFYSVHILDYCFGDYTPRPLPNATVSRSDISKNVTGCSNRTAMFTFDPTAIIEEKLAENGLSITLDDLNWPEDIQRGIDALELAQRTTFVLYCISIALIFLALVLCAPALLSSGRLLPCLNLMVAILAFLAIGLASALVTAVLVKGAEVINDFGNDIGIEAHRGDKFLALTWAATGAMLVALCFWSYEMCCGGRRKRRYADPYAKHG